VFDALPVTSHDVTGRYTLDELERELASDRTLGKLCRVGQPPCA
jgi:hypothetical protein